LITNDGLIGPLARGSLLPTLARAFPKNRSLSGVLQRFRLPTAARARADKNAEAQSVDLCAFANYAFNPLSRRRPLAQSHFQPVSIPQFGAAH
jgi:hypothetical protein